MDNTSIWVIYKDGKRLDKNAVGVKVHIAYLKKGAANGVVTSLVNNYLRWDLNISEYNEHSKWLEEEKKERSRYEVKEFVPKTISVF